MRRGVILNLYEIHEYKYEYKIRYKFLCDTKFYLYMISKKGSYKMTNIGLKYHTMF